MEKSQDESKLSLQDPASPHVITGETGHGEGRQSAERKGRTGLEGDEIQGGGEETKVVLLPVNPHLVHVYWGISTSDLEETCRVFSRLGPRAQPALRFYEAAELSSVDSARWFEAAIALGAGKWYVRLENPANAYCIDLGLRMPGGAFHRLARSNLAEMPKACPSDSLEDRYLAVDEHRPPSELVVATGVGLTESGNAFPDDATQGSRGLFEEPREASRTLPAYVRPRGPFEEPRDASRTVPAFAVPQGREENWPERIGVSVPVPAYAQHLREEGNVAAGQAVSPMHPLYDERQGDGEIDGEVERARLPRAPIPEGVERQLTEFHEHRRREWVWWERGARGKEESRTATKRCADLTELSERSFRAGLSSGQKLP